MNLYLLLEGKRSEAIIYPAWLASFERPFSRLMSVDHVSRSDGRSFFSFSANGYPSIVGSHLANAVADVGKFPGYDWLVVCLDVDEASEQERIDEVEAKAAEAGLGETPVRLFVVAQARCIESWLLGNPYLIGSSPPTYLASLRDFYDVRRRCPECMGKPRGHSYYSQFHFHYLREAFKARSMRYSKSNPGDAASATYFEALNTRLRNSPDAMPTFKRFVEFVSAL